MTDLREIDRQLDALGQVHADVADLVARYGERDRSLARADEALRELGAGVTVSGYAAPDLGVAVGDAPPAAEPPPRVRMRDLLDQELDPKEFPQTHPPPPPGAEVEATEDEGFELLVGDDDIMEIEDDDTQVTYEPERE
jgi:hypothetical protein